MNMVRLLIQVPVAVKAKLDALRSQGYTAAGFIRHVLERELTHASPGRKGR
jgi:mannitol/fructose-specific phosphotransferase system IIA component